MKPSELSGRALAEAAARVMGWRKAKHGGWLQKPGQAASWTHPFTVRCSAYFDYLCLEWARRNWRDSGARDQLRWRRMTSALPHISTYTLGDCARALVAASGKGKR